MRPGTLILAALASIVGWVAIGLLIWVVVMLNGCAGRDCLTQVDRDAFTDACTSCHVEGGRGITLAEHQRLVTVFGAAYTSRWCEE